MTIIWNYEVFQLLWAVAFMGYGFDTYTTFYETLTQTQTCAFPV